MEFFLRHLFILMKYYSSVHADFEVHVQYVEDKANNAIEYFVIINDLCNRSKDLQDYEIRTNHHFLVSPRM